MPEGNEAKELQAERLNDLTEEPEKLLVVKARKRAIHLLERMDRTEAQLREKLKQGGYPEQVIEDAIAYVKGCHYIDDLRYACNYVRYRRETRSRRQLAFELSGKGISRELAEQALSEEYGTPDESGKILRWLEKKNYSPESADEKQRQRMYRFLVQKGFHSGDILKML